MSKKVHALKKLEAVADVALNVELKKLSEIRAKEAAITERLDRLTQDVSARSATLRNAQDTDMAARLGADDRWLNWVRHERIEALQRAAEIASLREEQMEKTRRTLGKLDALKSLQKRVK